MAFAGRGGTIYIAGFLDVCVVSSICTSQTYCNSIDFQSKVGLPYLNHG